MKLNNILPFIAGLVPAVMAIQFDIPEGTVMYNCPFGTHQIITWSHVDTDQPYANLYQSYNHGDPAAIKLIVENVDVFSDRTYIPNSYLVARNDTRLRLGNAPEQIYAESVDIDVVC
jgi:hypothetical protein